MAVAVWFHLHIDKRVHASGLISSTPYLCSRNVAWISQTLTKDRRFLSSVQLSDMQMLPMV